MCSARVVAIDLRPLWIVHIEREDRERERQREREISVLTQWGATLVIKLRERERERERTVTCRLQATGGSYNISTTASPRSGERARICPDSTFSIRTTPRGSPCCCALLDVPVWLRPTSSVYPPDDHLWWSAA